MLKGLVAYIWVSQGTYMLSKVKLQQTGLLYKFNIPLSSPTVGHRAYFFDYNLWKTTANSLTFLTTTYWTNWTSYQTKYQTQMQRVNSKISLTSIITEHNNLCNFATYLDLLLTSFAITGFRLQLTYFY